MRKTVGILDDVVEYGQRLTEVINTRKNISLRATFILDPSEVKEKVASDRIQLLLVSEKYALQVEDASVPVYILTSEPQNGPVPDPWDRIIFRYSSVTDIVEMLLDEVKKNDEKRDEKLIVVFSPDSVNSSVNTAKNIAEKLAKDKPTLFLPMDNFYGKNGEKSITELLYTGLGNKENLRNLLTGIKEGGYDSFGGPEHFSDLWQYSEMQMNRLLDALLEAGYDHIVVASGFMSDAIYMLFKRCDVIYVPDLESGRSIEFIRQLTAAGDTDIVKKVREA